MRSIAIFSLLAAVLWAYPVSASPVIFGKDWKALEFFRIPATRFQMNNQSVSILAERSSSVIYRPLHTADWGATTASWTWETTRSVPPTDLSRKGGDDRNVAIYFVFLDEQSARRIGRTASIKKLLAEKNSRLLIYSYGGDAPRGSFQNNPYLDGRGMTIVKRPARPGVFEEKVDLAADYRRAFKGEPQALVGIAIASDSDDTGVVVKARVSGLLVE